MGFEDVVTGIAGAFVPAPIKIGLNNVRLVGDALFGEDHEDNSGEVQAEGNARRDDIYRERERITGDSDVEYLPPAITTHDPFASMSHQAIIAQAESFNPEVLDAVARSWQAIADRFSDGLETFNDKVQRAIGDKWHGASGTAAAEATADYASKGQFFSGAAQLIANKIHEANSGVEQTKGMLPPAPEQSWYDVPLDLIPVQGFWKSTQHEQQEAEEAARQIMQTVYRPVMSQSDSQVPALPIAVDPTNPVPAPGGAGHGVFWGGGSGAAPMPGVGGSLDDDAQILPGTGEPGVDDAAIAGQNPGAGTDSATPDLGDSLFGDNSGNSAAGTTAASAGATPTPGASGVGYGAGSGGGAGSGVGGGPGLSQPLSGGGIHGGGVTPGPAGAGAGTSGAAAAGSRAGMPMAGMAPGAGARGQGGEDKEHKTPGYLINEDNGNELIGELPTVGPSVIGE